MYFYAYEYIHVYKYVYKLIKSNDMVYKFKLGMYTGSIEHRKTKVSKHLFALTENSCTGGV